MLGILAAVVISGIHDTPVFLEAYARAVLQIAEGTPRLSDKSVVDLMVVLLILMLYVAEKYLTSLTRWLIKLALALVLFGATDKKLESLAPNEPSAPGWLLMCPMAVLLSIVVIRLS